MNKLKIFQTFQLLLMLASVICFIGGKTDYAIYGTVLAIFNKLNY